MIHHSFTAQYQLGQHLTQKHGEKAEQPQAMLSCVQCGFRVNTVMQMNDHLNICESNFKTIPPKICRFFVNGGCVKGNTCTFSHPENVGNKSYVPECRNGMRCRYLATGVCSFFHRGVGVQQRNRSQERAYCLNMEDCRRVPNCPYIHLDSDFPNLSKNHSPPIARAASVWQMY